MKVAILILFFLFGIFVHSQTLHQYLAIDLLKQFSYNSNENLIFSPLGIKLCLMILQANNFGNNDYKHLLNQFESINGNLNHQPNMNDSNEASNHNYWQTFLFLDEKQPIVNESFLHVLESKFNLKLMRFNIEKQDQYQSKFHTMFK